MYKNLKTLAVKYLENGTYYVYRKLFHAKQHFFFKWIPAPENCKNQEINKIKENEQNCQIMYTSNQ